MSAIRFHAIAALCLVLATWSASAQERKFGILSLVGDSFLIVNHSAATPTQPASDSRTLLPLPEHVFDNAVASDIQEAIVQAAPRAPVVKLAGAKSLYSREGEPLEDPRPVLARSQSAVSAAGVTHLVLVTKMRRTADVPLAAGEPEEKLDGLGFYVDPAVPTGNRDAPAAGYLAPFAYFRVWLVDVARQKVIGYREVAEISPVTGATNSVPALWASLSSAEKVRMVRSIVTQGAQGAVREMLRNLPD